MTAKPSIDEALDRAIAAQRNGQVTKAAEIYREILNAKPNHAEAKYFLGLCLHQLGQHDDALATLSSCPPLFHQDAGFAFNFALVLNAVGRAADAVITLKKLIDAGHKDPQILNAYGVSLRSAGDLSAATDVFEELTRDHADFAGAWFNLGNAHMAQGELSRALDALERAHALDPANNDVVRNLATCQQSIGNVETAIHLLENLLHNTPSDIGALNNLGTVYRQAGRHTDAYAMFSKALELDPSLADASYNLAAVYADLNDTAHAKETAARAVSLRPGFVKAQWLKELALPQIYDSEQQREDSRAAWDSGLARLIDAPLPDTGDARLSDHFAALSEITPFGLAYLGGDEVSSMRRWGDHAARIAARTFPNVSTPLSLPDRARKRVVFVSAHFRAHTIARLFGHWVTGLDREMFEVCLVSTSGPGDDQTQHLARACDIAITEPQSLTALVRTVHSLAADVIIYPDIGMDPRTQVLASLRLASKQMMAWGHPVTSGLPTMDAFLSSELMEPLNGEKQYREQLIRLPNLSISFERPPAPQAEEKSHTFLCAQALFKIPPRQDKVFSKLLQQVPDATLAFISHPIAVVTQAFQTRLFKILEQDAVDLNRVTFLPSTRRSGFLHYLNRARVALDTFDWSGGNTSLETIAMGVPIVSLPGRFMRGRHTAAMLQRIELTDLMARDEADYIDIACDLVSNSKLYQETCIRLRSNSDLLFNDPTPIAALNDVLKKTLGVT